MSWGCQACSKVGMAWMWSPADGNLSGLSLETKSLLVPDIKVQSFDHVVTSSYLK